MLQDLRYGFRTLRRAPGFTAVALLTLALGIGGTTAIFSVVDAILLRPLPYPAGDSLVAVDKVIANGGTNWAPADFLDYQRDARSLQTLAGYRQDVVDMTGDGEPVRLVGVHTTAGFFDAFGMPALAGRTYSASVDGQAGPAMAVISEALWRRQFGSAPDVVGSSVRLNGAATTIVGVVPRAFAFPADAEVWMLAPGAVPPSPLEVDDDIETHRDLSYISAVGRLAPGVTLDEARAELDTIGKRLAADYPSTNRGESATAIPLRESIVGDVKAALVVLLGSVAFVLLIACANVASLLLARGAGRRRELSVRAALGAGRGRLVRQLLVESVVLAAAGGALGLLVAAWGTAALVSLAPEDTPRLAEVAINGRALVFTMLASIGVGTLFGLAPAVSASRLQVTDALKDGGRTGTARSRLRSTLVVAEVALALMLLVGAGLMLASLQRLGDVDTGLSVDDMVVVGVPLPQARYDAKQQLRFYGSLLERLRANPATARAAVAFPTPFGGFGADGGYTVEGRPQPDRVDQPVAELNSISPGYLAATGVPLLRGREFTERDGPDAAPVVLVNQTLASREWPDEDPLGKRISLGGSPDDDSDWFTVVGVIADHRRANLADAQGPAVYIPYGQFTMPFMGVVLRTDAGEAAAASAVRAAVHEIDPLLPVDESSTVRQLIAASTGQPRFRAYLVGAFALTALLLAAVGLYGLVSYTVAQRVPELGVRLALGARPADVGRLVLGQALGLTAMGVAVGLAGAYAGSRFVATLLYGVSATDPAVYAGLAFLLLGVTAVAAAGPARRAMKVDPMVALRAE
ncbi:MAG: ABC transporter permease [Vicinamibacterales bacterium]